MTLPYPIVLWHSRARYIPALLVRTYPRRCWIITAYVDGDGILTIRHLHRVRRGKVITVDSWRSIRQAKAQ